MKVVITVAAIPWVLDLAKKMAYELRGSVHGVIIEDQHSFFVRLKYILLRIKRYGFFRMIDQVVLGVYRNFFDPGNHPQVTQDEREFWEQLKKVEVSNINDAGALRFIREEDADFCVNLCCGYMKKEIYTAPKVCALNIHGGFAPRYRGADPNVWAVLEGNFEYLGVTVHQIDAKIDAGAIYFQERLALGEQADTLRKIALRALEQGIKGVVQILDFYRRHARMPEAISTQDESHFYGWYGFREFLKAKKALEKEVLRRKVA